MPLETADGGADVGAGAAVVAGAGAAAVCVIEGVAAAAVRGVVATGAADEMAADALGVGVPTGLAAAWSAVGVEDVRGRVGEAVVRAAAGTVRPVAGGVERGEVPGTRTARWWTRTGWWAAAVVASTPPAPANRLTAQVTWR